MLTFLDVGSKFPRINSNSFKAPYRTMFIFTYLCFTCQKQIGTPSLWLNNLLSAKPFSAYSHYTMQIFFLRLLSSIILNEETIQSQCSQLSHAGGIPRFLDELGPMIRGQDDTLYPHLPQLPFHQGLMDLSSIRSYSVMSC